jgi:transcriptional regulator with XRE-family HTH domain
VSTLPERIEQVRLLRGWSQRKLAEAAGFKTTSQLGNTMRRLHKNPDAIELKTIKAIARGANVSETWLLTGDGAIEGELRVEYEERYENRAAVAKFYERDPSIDAVALQQFRTVDLHSNVDPEPSWWTTLLLQINARVKGDRADPSRVEKRRVASDKKLDELSAESKRLADAAWEGVEPPPKKGTKK